MPGEGDKNLGEMVLSDYRLHGHKDKSAGDEEMVLRIESGDSSVVGQKWANALYLAADTDPFALVERAVAAAAAMSGE